MLPFKPPRSLIGKTKLICTNLNLTPFNWGIIRLSTNSHCEVLLTQTDTWADRLTDIISKQYCAILCKILLIILSTLSESEENIWNLGEFTSHRNSSSYLLRWDNVLWSHQWVHNLSQLRTTNRHMRWFNEALQKKQNFFFRKSRQQFSTAVTEFNS